MLRLWGRISSINVRKVVLCAQVLGLDFERVDAGLSFGIVNTPDYRTRNPNGLVPLLEDGDFTLWESNAICRYLARREGRDDLLPREAQALQGPVMDKCLTRFRLQWNWTGGPTTIASRCVDSTGYVQPTVEDIQKVRAITWCQAVCTMANGVCISCEAFSVNSFRFR